MYDDEFELTFDLSDKDELPHSTHALELCHQGLGRFRADARNAWNIVRTVTHEGFQVDQMDRVKAIFLAEFCRVIIDRDGLRQLGRDKLNRHMLVDQL